MSQMRKRATRPEKLNLGSLNEREWMLRAACRGMDPAIFYPTATGNGADGRGTNYDEARDTCASCPVTVECEAHALRWREEFGVWGAKSPKERRPRGAEVRTLADHCERCGAVFEYTIAMTRGWTARKPRFCAERCEVLTEAEQREQHQRAEEVAREQRRRAVESYAHGETLRYG